MSFEFFTVIVRLASYLNNIQLKLLFTLLEAVFKHLTDEVLHAYHKFGRFLRLLNFFVMGLPECLKFTSLLIQN